MKMKRMVASILVLLLVVSLLPIGAMATDNDAGNKIETTTGDIGTNYGTIENNNHTVANNVAVKRDSGENVENLSSYLPGTGHIVNNNKVVKTNGTQNGGAESGIVKNNYGTVGVKGDDASGNYGTIYYNENGGKVLINQNTGVVDVNQKGGTIETNNGTVGSQNQFGGVEPGSGNKGTIETNSAGGKVLINQEGGTIGTNQKYGTVEINNGTVEINNGVIGRENDTEIDSDAGNFGTVNTNNGGIYVNHNQVGTNAGGGQIDLNFGNVGTNDTNASVSENYGTIGENKGKVITNTVQIEYDGGNGNLIPAVIKNNSGTVKSNYGTVETNAIDGVVTNHSEVAVASHADEDAASSEKEPVVLEGKVVNNFGTVVDETDPDNPVKYYGLSWGDNVQSLTLLNGKMPENADPVNLDAYAATATRSGYKMTGFTAFARKDGTDTKITDTANHTMKAPVWLQILWEKLGGKSAQPTKTPVYTSLSAEQVKVGMFVRCGKMTFKIIEVTDDSIRVATVGKLSDEALADMLGFLKQHLSDAQIAKLIGAPELLEQELVAKFFGGRYEHIAFYASADLFA